MAHDLDFLVYGATGYVGRRAARLLLEQRPEAKVGLAGRNAQKLEQLQQELGGGEVVVADSGDAASVDAAVARAPVVLACAGPFVRMGTPVVEACAKHGTHYVDITGETHWVHGLIERLGEDAKASGAVIVPFSGYDSVPSDLCTWLAVRHLREALGEGTAKVVSVMAGKGGINGGTAQTALAMFDHPEHQLLVEDPYVLCPDFAVNASEREARRDRPGSRKDLDGVRRAPFFMARINSRVVYRSAQLFGAAGAPYGEAFFYDELMDLGKQAASVKARVGSGVMRAMEAGMASDLVRPLFARVIPSSGQGPSEAQIENGFTHAIVVGEGEGGGRARVTLKAKGDPGNAVTALLLVSSARCLSEDLDALALGEGHKAGFLTPSFAFGDRLVERLREQGVTLEVTSD